jgi:membrane-associated phospholipid phosphatase
MEQQESNMSYRVFFRTIPENVGALFKGKNLLFHLLALVTTFIFVVSGFDWAYFKAVQQPALRVVLYSSAMLGGLLPILSPPILLLIGTLQRNDRLKTTAWMLAQAALIGLFLSFFYKALTGRLQPDLTNLTVDISRDFAFGILRRGVFWGWPSSHTTVAFSVGVAIFTLYRKQKYIAYSALVYAIYIGFGVSIGIHWFSEFSAGAIFGSIVGAVVGKSFLKQLKMTKHERA